MLHVQLSPGLPGGKWALLRPLCGQDEVLVAVSGPADLIAWLDRLLTAAPNTTVAPGKAAELAVCDCDRLCAALYQQYFGEQIDAHVGCRACGQAFALSFNLPELMQSQAAPVSPSVASGPDEQGLYRLPEGARFRLPTSGERRQVMGLEPDKAVTVLLRQCVIDADLAPDRQRIEAAMSAVGSLLDLDLEARCPHCEAEQTVRFDIQSYLLRAFASEGSLLQHEVHRIASAYGWSYQEILNLSREERRAFVRLIQGERGSSRAVEW